MNLRTTFTRSGLIALVAAVFGCSLPYTFSDEEVPLQQDALVVHGVAGDLRAWQGEFEIDDAPPGEYSVFTSHSPPTSLAGLAGVDLEKCRRYGDCEIPNLGSLHSLQLHDTPGRVTGGAWPVEDATDMFFVLVRRTRLGSGKKASITAKVSVGIGYGGCVAPPGPELTTSTLDGAPALPEPLPIDAGAPDSGIDAETDPDANERDAGGDGGHADADAGDSAATSDATPD